MNRRTRAPLVALLCAFAVAFAVAPAVPSAAAGTVTSAMGAEQARAPQQLCRPHASDPPDQMYCFGIVMSAGPVGSRAAGTPPAGYGPQALRDAYAVGNPTTRRTVAIVDAFDTHSVQSDLDTYRGTFGLPACTVTDGCLRIRNQSGGRALPGRSDAGWGDETSLDIEVVSAVCPSCHILLLESHNSSADSLGTAVRTAARLGARFISMSWGSQASPGYPEPYPTDRFYSRLGVAYVAASGDDGYGPSYPAGLPGVVSVGGTRLSRNPAGGWTERVWNSRSIHRATASGCTGEPRPSWQRGLIRSAACTYRVQNDISADADPMTGVAHFHHGVWDLGGGTSAAAPIIAAMYAVAGQPRRYSTPSYFPYAARARAFRDVTKGSNVPARFACRVRRLCVAGKGWDGPTGRGAPKGLHGVMNPPRLRITLHRHGFVRIPAGRRAVVAIGHRSQGTLAVHWAVRGAPRGVRITARGVLVGTSHQLGRHRITVTAHNASGAVARTSFRWTVIG